MLARYKAWADERLYAVLAGISEAELAAPTLIFAGSILRTLNHVYLMDVVWKSHLLGVAHAVTTRNPEATPAFAELHDQQAGLDAWFIDYAAGLSVAQTGEVVAFEFIGGGAGAMTRGEIVLHAVNHTTYHRGHVPAMLCQAGVAPPTTDLPVFLREQGQPTA
ncbi:MAG TPA: DinB family protein [Rhodanobacter sp.]|nr:DinB family protein [Rhodanobacter sp.]